MKGTQSRSHVSCLFLPNFHLLLILGGLAAKSFQDPASPFTPALLTALLTPHDAHDTTVRNGSCLCYKAKLAGWLLVTEVVEAVNEIRGAVLIDQYGRDARTRVPCCEVDPSI